MASLLSLLKAVAYKDGHKQTKALITSKPRGGTANQQIKKQRVEIEHRSQADHKRVS